MIQRLTFSKIQPIILLQTYDLSQSFEKVVLEPIIKQNTNNFSKDLLVLAL